MPYILFLVPFYFINLLEVNFPFYISSHAYLLLLLLSQREHHLYYSLNHFSPFLFQFQPLNQHGQTQSQPQATPVTQIQHNPHVSHLDNNSNLSTGSIELKDDDVR